MIDSKGRTNAQRVSKWGLAPIDKNGVPYELHHLGQKADAPLAILTKDEHRSKGNFPILHYAKDGKAVAANVWNKQKNEFWLELLKAAE